MIKHYEIIIGPMENPRPNASMAYRLYSALLSAVPAGYADMLHEQEITPIAQHLACIGTEAKWKISLFGEDSCRYFGDFFENNSYLDTEVGHLCLDKRQSETIQSGSDLISRASGMSDSKLWLMRIESPATFRSGGEYALFPSVELIVKSMVQRLNALCGSISIDDEEAVAMLISGIKIYSYHLNSAPFYIKGQYIPGFVGRLSLRTRLSPPMMELWKLLSYFSGFSGIGIKPALGMGGISVFPDEKQFQ